MTVRLRPASREDAIDVAALVDLSGEGLPRALWEGQADYGQDPIMVGLSQVQSDDGALSWTRATLAEYDGQIAGLVITRELPRTPETIDSDTSPIRRPLVRLENMARQSRAIVTLVTVPQFRRKGVATAMLAHAEARPGPHGMSVIVGDRNALAQSFLRSHGYRTAAELPLVHAGWTTPNTAWFLMRKH